MRQCKKQTTVAIIMKDGKFISMGTNEIHEPVEVCPRDEMGFKSGEGYHLCKETCGQISHAEVDACVRAGAEAKGASLYLMGHTYCCDNCISVMAEYGIAEVVVPDGIHPDTARIDKIKEMGDGYGSGWILRMSGYGRGARLHETTHPEAVPDIRAAIDQK